MEDQVIYRRVMLSSHVWETPWAVALQEPHRKEKLIRKIEMNSYSEDFQMENEMQPLRRCQSNFLKINLTAVISNNYFLLK